MAGRARREFGIVLAGRVLLALLSLVYLKLVLLLLGPTEFGVYTLVFSLASFLSMLLFAAANVPSTRLSAANPGSAVLAPAMVSLAAYLCLPSILACTLAAFVIFVASDVLTGSEAAVMAPAAGVIAASTGTIGLFSTFVLGQRRRILNVGLANGVIVARTLGLAILHVTSAASAPGVIWAVALSGSAFAALSARTVSHVWRGIGFSRLCAELSALGFVRQYRRNWIVAVGSNLFLYGDKVVLSFVLPIELIGLLAIYQQLTRALANISIGTIYQYVSPLFLKSRDASAENLRMVLKASSLAGAIYMAVVLALIPALGLINTYYLENVHVLRASEVLLVSLAVALSQAGRINELAFFTTDRVGRLVWPVLLSVLVFATAGLVWADAFGLIGAIFGLLAAAGCRYSVTIILMLQRRR